MNKKIYKNHTSFLFLATKHNTHIEKSLNTTIPRWVYFSIEMVGFHFYSNPKSSLSLLKKQKTKLKEKNPKTGPKLKLY